MEQAEQQQSNYKKKASLAPLTAKKTGGTKAPPDEKPKFQSALLPLNNLQDVDLEDGQMGLP